MTSSAVTAKEGRDPKDRILRAANDLFYREGVHAVGIDRILKEANAAKASLYAHFRSKDDLVAAYLETRGTSWKEHVEAQMAKHGGSARERLLLLFDLMEAWACDSEFRGCPFINAAGELSEPSHPAHAVAKRHRAWMQNLIHDLVRETGVTNFDNIARSVTILYDGSASVALVDSNKKAAATARWAVESLLDSQT